MLLSYANYDVLSIVETYLSNSNTLAKCLVGSEGTYNLCCCDRDNRKGGGVAIFCKRVLNPVRPNFPENLRAVEAVCIELTVASRQRILCEYRPPNCSNHYNENMCELISHCSRNVTNVIILGDFNLPLIDWSNNVSPITQQYNSFNECISENALTQHVNCPTRGNNTL